MTNIQLTNADVQFESATLLDLDWRDAGYVISFCSSDNELLKVHARS